jgi:hypothetical protein
MDQVLGYGPAFNVPGARDDLQPGNRSCSNWVGGVLTDSAIFGGFLWEEHIARFRPTSPTRSMSIVVASKAMGYFG